MIPLLRSCLIVSALSLLALGTPAADKKPSPPNPASTGGEEPKPEAAPPRTPLDRSKLPPGSIIVIDDGKDPLHLFPKMILVDPAAFQQMRDRLKQFEKLAKHDRVALNRCKLSGKLEGNFVQLKAEFGFKTSDARRFVTLGCQGTFLNEAEIDGQLPLLTYSQEEGYVAEVDRAGDHWLTLRLKLPVASRRLETLAGGAEHSVDLSLPGSPVTPLVLELPRTVKELRWNDNLEKHRPGDPRSGTWTIDLGMVKTLKLSWKESLAVGGVAPPLTARWHTTVKIQESHVVTTADVTLSDLRGQAREWRLWAPADAKLKVLAPEDTPYEVSRVDGGGIFLIKGPAAAQVQAQLTVTHPRPFVKLPVGPFTVLGVDRQDGTIEVRAAPEVRRGSRLAFHRQPDVRQQDLPRDQAGSDLVAVFQYWSGRESGKPMVAKYGAAPLELELKAVNALVETSVEHLLRLRPAEQGWQVLAITRIHATPLHDGVDFLDVQLPRLRPLGVQAQTILAGSSQATFPLNLTDAAYALHADELYPVQVPVDYKCVGEGTASSADLHPLPGQRKARIHLDRLQFKKFTVALSGTYFLPSAPPLPATAVGEVRRARLELPRPLTLLDRGGKVKLEVEENLELLTSEHAADAVVPERHQDVSVFGSAPQFADLAWRLYVPEFPVHVLADVTLHGRYAQVRQEMSLHYPERQAAGAGDGGMHVVELQAAAEVTNLKVVKGGTRRSYDKNKHSARVETAAREPLVLEYDFNLPPHPGDSGKEVGRADKEVGRPFLVPLFWPRGPTRGETKVRVWCDPGTVPTALESDLAAEPWRDLGTERVKSKASLPALVLRSEALNPQLRLRIPASALPALASVVAERALIQVSIDEKGDRHYRARFLLNRINVPFIDVEFPLPPERPGAQRPEILLDGERLSWQPQKLAGKVARLAIRPDLYVHAVVLDIRYDLPRDLPDVDGVWQVSLYPPVLKGDAFVGRVRWQVSAAPGRVALPPDGYVNSDQRWALRGWLLAPQTVDAERDLEPNDNAAPAGLAFWGNTLEPVHLFQLPQQAWLLLCSGVLLALGLGLVVLPLSRPLFWLVVVAVTVAVAAAGIVRPALMPIVVYGCEPGAVVLLLILGVQWLLQRHYRRRVVFMPGFTRLKPGSSLVRTGAARPRENSTIDAPPSALGADSKSSNAGRGGQS